MSLVQASKIRCKNVLQTSEPVIMGNTFIRISAESYAGMTRSESQSTTVTASTGVHRDAGATRNQKLYHFSFTGISDVGNFQARYSTTD